MRKISLIIPFCFLAFQFILGQVNSLSGNGKPDDPFVISRLDEFRYFRDQINNGVTEYASKGVCYELISDLIYTDEIWIPIGKNEEFPFNGYFEGNNKTISGINFSFSNSQTSSYAGLFGVCDSAVISNLTVDCDLHNGNITTANTAYIGGISALIKKSARVTGCKVKGNMLSNFTFKSMSIGAIVGRIESGSFIKNCGSDIAINCKSILSSSATNVFLDAGGIIGSSDGSATIRPSIINCYAHGAVILEGNYQSVTVGGIAGRNAPDIVNCIASGNISGIASVGDVKVAGIAGSRGGLITNCIAMSNSIEAVSTGQKILGRITDATQAWGVVSYCYANQSLVMRQGSTQNALSTIDHLATEKEMDKRGGKNLDGQLVESILNRYVDLPGFADKYIFINQTSFTETEIQTIEAKFGNQTNKRIAVGLGIIISVLNSNPTTFLNKLNTQLNLAKKYSLPILVKLDTEIWWQYRSDLWNWWDASKAGYNVNNKNNVEWSDWTSDAALKISWLDWGRQIRMLPPPNLMSPAYISAWKTEILKSVDAIKTWSNALPATKKHLFGGIVVGWESAIGMSSFYYPNGNDYLNQAETSDPTYGKTVTILPSRGVQTIGYASVKAAGIASSGVLTEQMQTEVVRRHLEDLSKTVYDANIPRTHIFTHCGGWVEGETLFSAANNAYSNPGWSFYKYASDPTKDLTIMAALAKSDAPYMGSVEWLLQGSTKTKSDWVTSLQNTLSKNTRLNSIYNWGQIKDNVNALDALLEMNISKNNNDSVANTIQNRKWMTLNGKLVFDDNTFTSISTIPTEKIKWKINYQNGILSIHGKITQSPISIFDMNGKLTWRGLANNNQIRVELKNGLYLIENQMFIVK